MCKNNNESKKSNSNLVAGMRQSKKLLNRGYVKLAYIARDAESHVVFAFENLCKENNVDIVYINTMRELSKMCGVSVPTAVAVAVYETK